MGLEITNKVCIERDGKIIASYDVNKIEKVIIDGEISEDLFIYMKDGGYFNFIKIFDDDTVTQTAFNNCRIVYDFDKDLVCKLLFDKGNSRSANYIDTNLKLLFEEDKYFDIQKVENGLFIVIISKVFVERGIFKSKMLYGVISKDGTEVLPCVYSNIMYDSKEDEFIASL